MNSVLTSSSPSPPDVEGREPPPGPVTTQTMPAPLIPQPAPDAVQEMQEPLVQPVVPAQESAQTAQGIRPVEITQSPEGRPAVAATEPRPERPAPPAIRPRDEPAAPLGEPEPVEETVQVTIGRIEVRLERQDPRPAAKSTAPSPRQPGLSLAEYLERRAKGTLP